jgi:membrane protein
LLHGYSAPNELRNAGFASILRPARERFYSFALILAAGLLLLVSVVLNALVAAMGSYYSSLPSFSRSRPARCYLFLFVSRDHILVAIYKLLPEVHLRWSDVAIGASVTSLLFTIGKQLIGLYLGEASFGSTYGAAGSLVIVLVWVYYSSMLFFLGAEFTKVYTKTFGSQSSNKLATRFVAGDSSAIRLISSRRSRSRSTASEASR